MGGRGTGVVAFELFELWLWEWLLCVFGDVDEIGQFSNSVR